MPPYFNNDIIYDMIDIKEIKKAKAESTGLLLKNYFPIKIDWQRTLDFIYSQATQENKELFETKRDVERNVEVFGNVLTQHPFWLAPQTGLVWKDFPEIKEFIKKLNLDFNSSVNFEDCDFYKHWDLRSCSCKSLWHSEGIKVSLSNKFVPGHSDPWEAMYLQITGKSFWRIKGSDSTVYELDEGDLLYFPKQTSHEVWSEGPRMGLLVNAIIHNDIEKVF